MEPEYKKEPEPTDTGGAVVITPKAVCRCYCRANVTPSPVKPEPVIVATSCVALSVPCRLMGFWVPELRVSVSFGVMNVPEIVWARVPVGVFVIVPDPVTTPPLSASDMVNTCVPTVPV